ncbi:hypothetical protein ACRRTK_007836 [Alexandromys fortis]
MTGRVRSPGYLRGLLRMRSVSTTSIPASACAQLWQIRQGLRLLLLLLEGLENSRNLPACPASRAPPPPPRRTQGGVAHLSPERPTWVSWRRG